MCKNIPHGISKKYSTQLIKPQILITELRGVRQLLHRRPHFRAVKATSQQIQHFDSIDVLLAEQQLEPGRLAHPQEPEERHAEEDGEAHQVRQRHGGFALRPQEQLQELEKGLYARYQEMTTLYRNRRS